jgi:hypothetical protein
MARLFFCVRETLFVVVAILCFGAGARKAQQIAGVQSRYCRNVKREMAA